MSYTSDMSVETLLQEFTRLPKPDQKQFLAEIMSYLVDDTEDYVIPDTVVAENCRRLAAYDAGEMEGIPYKEAMKQVRGAIDARRWNTTSFFFSKHSNAERSIAHLPETVLTPFGGDSENELRPLWLLIPSNPMELNIVFFPLVDSKDISLVSFFLYFGT